MNLERLFEALQPRVTAIVEANQAQDEQPEEAKQHTPEEMLAKIRKGVYEQMDAFIDSDKVNAFLMHEATQSWLLIQILDRLEDINTKVAMMKVDAQDVEQAILALKSDK